MQTPSYLIQVNEPNIKIFSSKSSFKTCLETRLRNAKIGFLSQGQKNFLRSFPVPSSGRFHRAGPPTPHSPQLPSCLHPNLPRLSDSSHPSLGCFPSRFNPSLSWNLVFSSSSLSPSNHRCYLCFPGLCLRRHSCLYSQGQDLKGQGRVLFGGLARTQSGKTQTGVAFSFS